MTDTLAQALEAQRRVDECSCFCDPDDYDALIAIHGADHVNHSEYCQKATAALAEYKALRGDA